MHAGTVLDFSDADWDLAFNLNARSMAHTIRAFLPGMLAQGGGSTTMGLPAMSASGLSGRRVEASRAGMRTVNFTVLAKASGKTEAEVKAMFVARQPMGRLGTADEIAALAVYLASDEAAFTTGSVMIADGGMAN